MQDISNLYPVTDGEGEDLLLEGSIVASKRLVRGVTLA